MMGNKELLRRIDERNYLTEREYREFLDRLNKDLEEKELLETELKLEKNKVKYVMKQLKKQDEILDILKQHISIAVDTVYNFDTDKDERIEFVVFNGKFVGLNDGDKATIKEWLDNGNV